MDRRAKAIITTLMVVAVMIGTDFTGVLLLVSPIESDFSVDITTTQWVLNIYALTFGIFMVAGGRLGDIYGRRRLLLTGLAIFLAASLGCLLAPSIVWLIAARAVQGLGAALIWPSVMALGSTSVAPEKRGMAFGLILAGITSGDVVGPLIGGLCAWLGDWRMFFVVNTVLAILAVILARRFVPKEAPSNSRERVDYCGIVVLGGALLALLYGLDVGADWGWGAPKLLVLLGVSAILFLAFPFVERHVDDPMVPPSLMGNREFMLAVSINGLMIPAIFVAFLYFPQYLQKVLGWPVLQASLGMAPLMVLLAIGSLASGRFYEIVGPKRLLLAGYGLTALGAAWVVLPVQSWGYFAVLPAMLLIGSGGAAAVGASGTAAMSAVASSHTGLAGGLGFMVHMSLGAIGVAGATAIMNASSLASLKQGLTSAGISVTPSDLSVLNAAVPDARAVHGVLASHGSGEADRIRALMVDAFATGMSQAYWLALALVLLGILAVVAIDEKKLQTVQN